MGSRKGSTLGCDGWSHDNAAAAPVSCLTSAGLSGTLSTVAEISRPQRAIATHAPHRMILFTRFATAEYSIQSSGGELGPFTRLALPSGQVKARGQ